MEPNSNIAWVFTSPNSRGKLSLSATRFQIITFNELQIAAAEQEPPQWKSDMSGIT